MVKLETDLGKNKFLRGLTLKVGHHVTKTVNRMSELTCFFGQLLRISILFIV